MKPEEIFSGMSYADAAGTRYEVAQISPSRRHVAYIEHPKDGRAPEDLDCHMGKLDEFAARMVEPVYVSYEHLGTLTVRDLMEALSRLHPDMPVFRAAEIGRRQVGRVGITGLSIKRDSVFIRNGDGIPEGQEYTNLGIVVLD